MKFEITQELIQNISQFIEEGQDKQLKTVLNDLHFADIAEILEELKLEESLSLIHI